MSTPARPQRRAVRLHPEALYALRGALVRRWQEDEQSGRLTRDLQAELLGVSAATAGRILSGAAVSRSTLSLAFKCLGLVWDDSYCVCVQEEAGAASRLREAVRAVFFRHPPTGRGRVDLRRSARRRRYVLGSAIVGLTVVAICWTFVSHRVSAPSSSWMDRYNAAFDDGMARFHKADYPGARAALDRATALARDHDSAAYLSGALRLAGDIEAAEGRLALARDRYRTALDIRAAFAQDEVKPAILEALGEVETKLGDLKSAGRSLGESLAGYRRFKDPVGVALASRSLGSVAFESGDLDSAEAWFEKSLTSVEGLSKPDIVADINGRCALVSLKRGRAGEARGVLRECLTYWTARGQTRWIAVCELRLASVEAALGDYPTAIRRASRSEALFVKIGDGNGASDAAARLSMIEASVGGKNL